jgi:hypothetical protein
VSWPLALALALMGAGASAGSPPGVRGADAPAQPAQPTQHAEAAARPGVVTSGIVKSPTPAAACELRLTEHRSGRELKRLPLDARAPEIRIAFEHSVLGTTVIDRYRFTPAPLLVEEEFEGEGYGLPATAGPGERLERIGTRQRLTLARPVDPLVVRALAGPRMRLLLPQGELLLASLGAPAVALEAVGCASPQP